MSTVIKVGKMENTIGKILLIASDVSKSNFLIQLFNEYDFKVLTADSGQNALDMLNRELFNLILIDGVIADIDIKIFCDRVRENPKIANLPIIVLCDKSDIEYRSKAITSGVDGYLLKPISNEELISQLSEFMGNPISINKKTNEKSTIITFTSNKGGTGVSTLVANLGYLFGSAYNKKILLVDAAGYTNHLSTLLNVFPQKSFADLCRIDARKISEDDFFEIATKVNENLSIINFVSNISDLNKINLKTLEWAFDIARNHYDFILIDTKSGVIDDIIMFLIQCANDLLLLTTYDPLAMKDTKKFIKVLQDYGIPENKMKLIINRANCEIGNIDPDLIHKNLNFPIFCTLPNDWKACIEAADKSKTFIENSPKSILTRELKVLSDYYIKNLEKV